MQQILRFRAKVNRIIRQFFDSHGKMNILTDFLTSFVLGFIEVETPILFKSSPEGAKEFLVPRPDGLNYAFLNHRNNLNNF